MNTDSTTPTETDIFATLQGIKADTEARLAALEEERRKVLRDHETQVRVALASYRSRVAA